MNKKIIVEHDQFFLYEKTGIVEGVNPHSTVDYSINGIKFFQLFYDDFNFSQNDILGYLFLFFGLFIFFINFKKFDQGYYFILVSLISHQLVIFINSYFYLLPGQMNDALYYVYSSGIYFNNPDLNLKKILLMNFFRGDLFNKISTFLYFVNGHSKFTLMQLNFIFYVFSIIYIFKTVKLYNIKFRYELVFFIILPSLLFFTSASLKESISLLSVSVFLYYISKIYISNLSINIFFKIVIASIFFLETQKGHALILIFLIFILLIQNYKFLLELFSLNNFYFKSFFAITIIPFLFIILQNVAYTEVFIARIISDPINIINSLFIELTSFRSIANPEAFTYLNFNDYNPSEINFFIKIGIIFLMFINYLFFIPIYNFDFKSAILFYESIFRFVGIFGLILATFKLKIDLKIIFTFFLTYIFVYSLGTLNYGTALRHHVPIFPIYLMGIYYFFLSIRKQNLKNNE